MTQKNSTIWTPSIKFTVQSGDVVLASAKRMRAAPGEMEKLVVKADLLKTVTEDITVSLEVVEG